MPDVNQLFAQAVAHDERGEWVEAARLYDECLQFIESPEIHANLGMCLLRLGDYGRGFREFEWRQRSESFLGRLLLEPQWRGENIAGKSLGIVCGHYLGDLVQFIRYAPTVKDLGASVSVIGPRECSLLLQNMRAVDLIAKPGDAIPIINCYCLADSLPACFGTTLETVPAEVPYLRPHPSRLAFWQTKFRESEKLKIGINWEGDEADLYPIRNLSHVEFVPIDITAAFSEVMAMIKAIDLVISGDTMYCHLAGALGAPVWTALPKVHDWRWLADRDDSPWYPTMRLFRQKQSGDWNPVFEAMKMELENAYDQLRR